MKIFYFLGIFLLSSIHCVYEKINPISPGEKKLLCTLFPETFREKCSEYSPTKPIGISEIEIHAQIKIKMTNSEDSIQSYCTRCDRENKSFGCDVCKKLIQQVIDAIGSNHSKDVVRKELEKVCDGLPFVWKPVCKDIVDKFADTIVDEIVKNLPADKICQNIGLCSSLAAISPPREKSVLCWICSQIIEEIFKQIGERRVAEEIKRALEGVCNIFPVIYRHQCNEFVDRYAVEIVKLILEGKAGGVICSALQLCETRNYPTIKSKDTMYFLPKFALN